MIFLTWFHRIKTRLIFYLHIKIQSKILVSTYLNSCEMLINLQQRWNILVLLIEVRRKLCNNYQNLQKNFGSLKISVNFSEKSK